MLEAVRYRRRPKFQDVRLTPSVVRILDQFTHQPFAHGVQLMEATEQGSGTVYLALLKLEEAGVLKRHQRSDGHTVYELIPTDTVVSEAIKKFAAHDRRMPN